MTLVIFHKFKTFQIWNRTQFLSNLNNNHFQNKIQTNNKSPDVPPTPTIPQNGPHNLFTSLPEPLQK